MGQKERPLRHLGSQGTKASPELQLQTVAQLSHDRVLPIKCDNIKGLLRWIGEGSHSEGNQFLFTTDSRANGRRGNTDANWEILSKRLAVYERPVAEARGRTLLYSVFMCLCILMYECGAHVYHAHGMCI